VQGGEIPPHGGSRVVPPRIFFPQEMCHIFPCFRVSLIFVSIVGRFFGTWFFAGGFLFSVKELGLLTNPGHWVRFLDGTDSYMYIVL
jgi:hypothetical protein